MIFDDEALVGAFLVGASIKIIFDDEVLVGAMHYDDFEDFDQEKLDQEKPTFHGFGNFDESEGNLGGILDFDLMMFPFPQLMCVMVL